MKLLIGIRTNIVDSQIDFLYSYYKNLGFDVVILCDESLIKYESSFQEKISLHKFYLEKIKLKYIHNYGWSCGDYFMYSMLLHFKNYDGYLLLEDDLVLRLKNKEEIIDFLKNKEICVPHYNKRSSNWVWYEAAKKISDRDSVYGCIFGMIYLRRDALSRLYEARVDYCRNHSDGDPWCGDEGFLLNHPSMNDYRVTDWGEFFSEGEMNIEYTSAGVIDYLSRADFSNIKNKSVSHPALINSGGESFLVRESKILKRQINKHPNLIDKIYDNKNKAIDVATNFLKKII